MVTKDCMRSLKHMGNDQLIEFSITKQHRFSCVSILRELSHLRSKQIIGKTTVRMDL
jgi:hypothetical protein